MDWEKGSVGADGGCRLPCLGRVSFRPNPRLEIFCSGRTLHPPPGPGRRLQDGVKGVVRGTPELEGEKTKSGECRITSGRPLGSA